jgi:hypothetical protein
VVVFSKPGINNRLLVSLVGHHTTPLDTFPFQAANKTFDFRTEGSASEAEGEN